MFLGTLCLILRMNFIIHKFDNKEQIERAILPESNLPYLDELIKQITHINPNRNDVVICDVYF